MLRARPPIAGPFACRRGLVSCLGLVAVVLSAAACATSGQLRDPRSLALALLVSPEDLWRHGPPEALSRVRSSPHSYYRFISVPFNRLVCQVFANDLAKSVRVNLHGDAHLEQYAVTSVGYGLIDFDSAARGPAFLDLMRFAVSLRLAALERGWASQTEALLGRFLGGYRAALVNPEVTWPEPRPVARARQALGADHPSALGRAEGWMSPVPEGNQPPSLEAYAGAMRAAHPELGEGFFAVKRVGLLRMGIGSAVAPKYLFRVEGPTPAPEDDLVLEAKPIGSLAGVGCIEDAPRGPQVLVANELLGRPPFRFSGTVTEDSATYWVFEWADAYAELDIRTSYANPAELAEVAADAGAQLGAAHLLVPGKPPDPGTRRELSHGLVRIQPRLGRRARMLADAVVRAWRDFGGDAPLPAPSD
jgi:hypothetical protein